MNRFSDAIDAQAGACNPTALAGALSRHMSAMTLDGADTPTVSQDPAVRLIAHQLAFLLRLDLFDASAVHYLKTLNQCDAGEKQSRMQAIRDAGDDYDTALPQEWFDQAHKASRENPAGHVVWAYTKTAGIFGEPIAVTRRGDQILRDLARYDHS